jgi:hypothetical protein
VGICSNVSNGGQDSGTCTGQNLCNGSGACLPLNGAACVSGAACFSGNCVDGVCCDSTCTGACQACNINGTLGTCSPVAQLGTDAACMGAVACDGAGVCALANGQFCGADTDCASGRYDIGGSFTCF